MNKSELFKKAHALTRATVKIGDSYSATFSLCLKSIYSSLLNSPIEVALRIGGREWNGGEHHRVYFNKDVLLNALNVSVEYYGKTKNIKRIDGESYKTTQSILTNLYCASVYYDVNNGNIVIAKMSESQSVRNAANAIAKKLNVPVK